jgi:hypothetical protein
MNDQRILEELLELLAGAGVEVRRDALGGGGGGPCTIKGQGIFFVDTQSTANEVAALAAEAVATSVDVESIYMRPEVREFIESRGKAFRRQ